MNLSKKLSALILSLVFVLSLTGCMASREDDKKKKKDERVLDAIEFFSDYWEDYYDDYEKMRKNLDKEFTHIDRSLEIVNTKIINIKSNVETDVSPEYWEEIDYIVEFSFETNFYGTTPDYYSDISIHGDCVVVYKDGRMEVESNVISKYINTTGVLDFSGIIESIENFHGEYDQVIKLD